jgi:hypothetical protein
MYDFPANPADGDEYIPPTSGQTYIWKSPRWLVKGIPPQSGAAGGGGIEEAPVDGNLYGRSDAAWEPFSIPATDWNSITGKPATFPPTVPIPWANVSNKPSTFPPALPIAWTDVSGKPTTFPPTVPIAWTDVGGKPATFPPTLPIAQSAVTNLTSDIAALNSGKENVIAAGNTGQYWRGDKTWQTLPAVPASEPPISAGTVSQYWRGDKTWQAIDKTTVGLSNVDNTSDASKPISTAQQTALNGKVNDTGDTMTGPLLLNANPTLALQAATKQYVDSAISSLPPSGIEEAPKDGRLYSRKDGGWTPGIPDAPQDGKYYVRKDGSWTEIPPPAPSPWAYDSNGDVILTVSGSVKVRIKPSGLIMTKDDIEIFSVSV